jgi:hypothetical protein
MDNTQSNYSSPGSFRPKTFNFKVVISFLAVSFLAVFLFVRLDVSLSETWNIIRGIDISLYILALFVHYLTFFFRGIRWRLLLINVAHVQKVDFNPPSLKYSTSVMLMSWFATSVTIFRMGDVFRAYVYARDSNSSFSGSAGTVFADRVVDFIAVLILMASAILLFFLEGKSLGLALGSIGITLFSIGVVSVSVMFLFLVGMKLTGQRLTYLLPKRFQAPYIRFHASTLGSFRKLPLVFTLGILAWICEVGTWFFIIQALDAHVSIGLILFIPPVNALQAVLALTPGSLGVLEIGTTALLYLQISVEIALAAVLVDRTLMIISMVTGGILLAARQIKTPKLYSR